MNRISDCIFCLIAAGKIPAKKVYEDPKVLAFLDINPVSEGHTLVIPKNHYETISLVPDSELGVIFRVIKKLATNMKDKLGVDGINIIQNNYKAAGQDIPHFHVHIIPRKNNDGRVKLPLGKKAEGDDLDKILQKLA
jgi:histidine triad (HIT) family protein